MRYGLFLALLLLVGLVSGCVSRDGEEPSTPVETETPVTEETDGEIPNVEEVTEEDLAPEVDLEINDTVDLGSLL